MYSPITRELRDAYNSIYSQKNDIDEIMESIKHFTDSLIEEGFDVSEMTQDDLYNLYQFCIYESIDLNEGPLSFIKGIAKDPKVQQAALRYGQKYGGKLVGALKTGAKDILKIPTKGVETAFKAVVKPLQTPLGATAATAAGIEAIAAGEKSKVRQVAGKVGPTLTDLQKKVYGDDQKPALAKPAPTQPKPEKPKPQPISKLYEDNVTEDAPLTVSGGITGTGVGKKFKARSWTPAEVQRYKAARGAEQIKTDVQFQKDMSAMNRQIASTPKGRDPEFYRPAAAKPAPTTTRPAAAKPAPTTTRPAAAKPAPTPTALKPIAQTGDKAKDTAVWAQRFPKLAAKVVTSGERAGTQMGTGQSVMAKQAADLRSMQKVSQERQAAQSGPMYSSPDVKSKMSTRTKNVLGVNEQYDAFDLVLEYLLSQGHVDTLEEALYVMMEMSSETVQEIVEGIMPEPINPEVHRRLQRIEKATKLQQGTKGAESQAAGSAVKRMGGSGVQLPGV